MTIKDILKQPINMQPIATQFIETKKVEVKPLIKSLKGPKNYNEKDRAKVEHWLSFCAIGTQIVETGTKALSNMGLIHSRDGVFDLIMAFKQLNTYFTGNENYDAKERIIDDFVFTFLTCGEEKQNRTIKFLESLINKAK
jgi:hypothetical protein